MSEQVSPEQVSTENELICERLLGWKRSARGAIVAWSGWHNGTPSFTTWAEAGLILEAFHMRSVGFDVGNLPDCWYCDIGHEFMPIANEGTGPLAIRKAALAYIGSQR